MGFIADSINKAGPGVAKDAPEKKGLARFWEILSRDFIDFVRLNLIIAVIALPFTAVLALFFLADVKPLILLPVAWLLFLPVGPAITAMNKIVLKRIRNIPCFVWHEFKKGYKESFKQSLIFTAIVSILFAILGFSIYSWLFIENNTGFFLLACLFLALVSILSISNYVYAQIATVNLSLGAIFKNAILLTLGRANRTLPAVLIQIVLLGAAILFIPYTTILFGIGLITLVNLITNLWLWPALKLICEGKNTEVEVLDADTKEDIRTVDALADETQNVSDDL